MLAIDKKRCVGCGNCRLFLGDDIMKRFKYDLLELTQEEFNELRGKIENALEHCYLEALKLV